MRIQCRKATLRSIRVVLPRSRDLVGLTHVDFSHVETLDPSFPKLESLDLRHFPESASIPTVYHALLNRILLIVLKHAHHLKYLSFCSSSRSDRFFVTPFHIPYTLFALQNLVIKPCLLDDSSGRIFPDLRSLALSNCPPPTHSPHLISPNDALPKLESFSGSSYFPEVLCKVDRSVQTLCLDGAQIGGVVPDFGSFIAPHWQTLLASLQYLRPSPVPVRKLASLIRKLDIEELPFTSSCLTSLEELTIGIEESLINVREHRSS